MSLRIGFGEPCYFCGDPVFGRAVFWHGTSRFQPQVGDIMFHPVCAALFVMRFARDVWAEDHGEDAYDFRAAENGTGDAVAVRDPTRVR